VITVRPYDKTRFPNQRLEQDALPRLGIDPAILTPPNQHVNPSLRFEHAQAIFHALSITRNRAARQAFRDQLLAGNLLTLAPCGPNTADLRAIYDTYGAQEAQLLQSVEGSTNFVQKLTHLPGYAGARATLSQEEKRAIEANMATILAARPHAVDFRITGHAGLRNMLRRWLGHRN
jgi:hypothetical protein